MPGVLSVVAAFALAGGPNGSSPTPEETVAYFVHGLEQGAIPKYGQQADEPMKQVSRSPAIFTSTGPNEVGDKTETIRFIVTRLDDCTYKAEQQFEEDGDIYYRLTYEVRLGNVTALSFDSPPFAISLKGLVKSCSTDTEGSCDLTREPETIGPFFGEPGPAEQALTYFHEKFCPLKP
ncbi:hypothetical protein FJV80_11120 [Mesorhizobium sp. WSM4310]|uniref:hypothetical protein n=1 Tax=Mesorhizobium sp. WSM4310 TaxID=2589883 RepID=UPI00115CA77D|nr:hypothetical protein [Mesorhizobium sp. WSM4310]TRC88829.1 hypothetical protein FJV80_11120 [Mesorhizobium sp. WSM4310]